VLAVSAIGADDPSILAAPASFDLSPGEMGTVTVTCAPGEARSIASVLTIASNDPDTPLLPVDLTAEALMPPIASVSPSAIETTVETGQTRLDSLVLANPGGSELVWTARTGRLATASGLRILWHGDHGWGDILLWSVIVGDLEAKGAVVTQSTASITPELLAMFDIIWFGNRDVPFTADEISALVAWSAGGGHILIEADSDGSRTVYNALLEALEAGVFYWSVAGITGPTTNVYPHETTAGVDEIFLVSARMSLGVMDPAGLLVADLFGRSIIAYSVVGDGRIVVVSDHTFHDVAIHNGDNRTFGNQVFEWFGASRWLTVTPDAGSIGAGGSAFLQVATDATVLAPGYYELNVIIESNDPATPTNAVPVRVTVTPSGALLPSIECPPDVVVPALSTVPSMTLDGFRITNVGTAASSFVYSVTGEGAATLDDNGDPASLSGTTPVLAPGESYEPPDAGLIVPAIRAIQYEHVAYRAGLNDLVEAASCTTVVRFEPPVPVLVTAFDAVAVEEGVDLAWNIAADEEILGFRIYRALEGSTHEEISPAGLISPQTRSYRDDRVSGGRAYEYTLGVVLCDRTEVTSRPVVVTTRIFALALHQNTPNPFNPSTMISFTLPAKSRVTISIYDVKGRRVKTLVDESIEEGYHERAWDGKDDAGGQVSTGIYFYSLTAGDRRLTRKMLLLK
jgi:hypothetical protein